MGIYKNPEIVAGIACVTCPRNDGIFVQALLVMLEKDYRKLAPHKDGFLFFYTFIYDEKFYRTLVKTAEMEVINVAE